LELPLPIPRRRLGLIVAGLLAVIIVVAAAVRLWPSTDQVEGHSYPIPSGEDGRLVEVLNGTDRLGLARVSTRQLRRAGFDVILFRNAPELTDSTDILVRRGEVADGERIRAVLGVGRVRLEIDTLRRVDVSVILGADYDPVPELHP
jgi:hypothetical protein